ncbi:hypothetical protein AVEN_123054-1 [Araneus ventricosus]|uniref:Helitron helicase-like domain-containing protein n=1 Tax=Araneus ventricosus TaxID=182803 RepID=A0A4Y2MFK2_ARAVE|nr:hypothetical protein AVEN_123054-1 [Araneus ventricosus]
MGEQIKPPRRTGPYCYRLHGQVYHRVSPLYASDQHKESYGQLYIFDSSEATEKRLSNNQNCLQHVFEKFDFMLREINPFAQPYLQMHRLVQEHTTTSVKTVFLEDKNLDMRRYNALTLCIEVAAIFVGDNGEPPANLDICVYPVGDTCQSISPLNQCCDPMTYPLLFPGSPRRMQQNYQDAMAMVRKFGMPDLFLTFTCNPSWSEILNSMEGVQRPEDRPDIIVRVFNMKLKELLEDICKHGIFGTVLAYIYVIEFQKRGLPDTHNLLTLDSESKIRTKDDIDKFVSAELPDPCTDLRLFQIVTKCMVHGQSGTISIYNSLTWRQKRVEFLNHRLATARKSVLFTFDTTIVA